MNNPPDHIAALRAELREREEREARAAHPRCTLVYFGEQIGWAHNNACANPLREIDQYKRAQRDGRVERTRRLFGFGGPF